MPDGVSQARQLHLRLERVAVEVLRAHEQHQDSIIGDCSPRLSCRPLHNNGAFRLTAYDMVLLIGSSLQPHTHTGYCCDMCSRSSPVQHYDLNAHTQMNSVLYALAHFCCAFCVFHADGIGTTNIAYFIEKTDSPILDNHRQRHDLIAATPSYVQQHEGAVT